MIKTSVARLGIKAKKTFKQIDTNLLALLNQGTVEARNLMEGLSIDFPQLIELFLKTL